MATIRASFGRGSGPIFLDDTTCSGDESSLIACPNRGIGRHNCGHSEDAGVICKCEILSIPVIIIMILQFCLSLVHVILLCPV